MIKIWLLFRHVIQPQILIAKKKYIPVDYDCKQKLCHYLKAITAQHDVVYQN